MFLFFQWTSILCSAFSSLRKSYFYLSVCIRCSPLGFMKTWHWMVTSCSFLQEREPLNSCLSLSVNLNCSVIFCIFLFLYDFVDRLKVPIRFSWNPYTLELPFFYSGLNYVLSFIFHLIKPYFCFLHRHILKIGWWNRNFAFSFYSLFKVIAEDTGLVVNNFHFNFAFPLSFLW